MQRPSLAIRRKRKADKDAEIDFFINSKGKRSKPLNWGFETVTMPVTRSKALGDKKERYLVYFGGLPVEIVMLIFQYLGLEWFHRLAQVNWSFNETVKTPYLLRETAKTSVSPLPMYHRGMWKELLQWMHNYEALSQSFMRPDVKGVQVIVCHLDGVHVKIDITNKERPNAVVENFKKLRHAFMSLPNYWVAHPDKCDLPTLEQWTEYVLIAQNKGPAIEFDTADSRYINQTNAVYAAMTSDLDRVAKALFRDALSHAPRVCRIVGILDEPQIFEKYRLDERFQKWSYATHYYSKKRNREWFYENYGFPRTVPRSLNEFKAIVRKMRNEMPPPLIQNLARFVLCMNKPAVLETVYDDFVELRNLQPNNMQLLFDFPHCQTKVKLYVFNSFHHTTGYDWQKAFGDLVVKKHCTWDELMNRSNDLDFQTFIYDLACGHIAVQRKDEFVRALFASRKKKHVLKGIKISVLLTRYDTILLLASVKLNKKDFCDVLRCIRREHHKRLMTQALLLGNSKLVSALFTLGYEPSYGQNNDVRSSSSAIQKEFKDAKDRILF
ncbi:MAG: hypothetical protein CMP20_10405 [Rickettsiales bacterium]|nr:hypothetical protein [Rickettsiales bacterium]